MVDDWVFRLEPDIPNCIPQKSISNRDLRFLPMARLVLVLLIQCGTEVFIIITVFRLRVWAQPTLSKLLKQLKPLWICSIFAGYQAQYGFVCGWTTTLVILRDGLHFQPWKWLHWILGLVSLFTTEHCLYSNPISKDYLHPFLALCFQVMH